MASETVAPEELSPEELARRYDLVLPVDRGAELRKRLAARTEGLDGKRLGVLNNSKGNADLLLGRIAQRLRERYRLDEVLSVAKPIFSRTAPSDQLEQLKRCDVVVTAIAD